MTDEMTSEDVVQYFSEELYGRQQVYVSTEGEHIILGFDDVQLELAPRRPSVWVIDQGDAEPMFEKIGRW
jgi:hypothetical protein